VKGRVLDILPERPDRPAVLWLLMTNSGHLCAGGLCRDRYSAGLAMARELHRQVVESELVRLRTLRGVA